jgi:hypothetical protein
VLAERAGLLAVSPSCTAGARQNDDDVVSAAGDAGPFTPPGPIARQQEEASR